MSLFFSMNGGNKRAQKHEREGSRGRLTEKARLSIWHPHASTQQGNLSSISLCDSVVSFLHRHKDCLDIITADSRIKGGKEVSQVGRQPWVDSFCWIAPSFANEKIFRHVHVKFGQSHKKQRRLNIQLQTTTTTDLHRISD